MQWKMQYILVNCKFYSQKAQRTSELILAAFSKSTIIV